jgi:elongation factor P
MIISTFDQTELSADYLKDELKYLKANMEVQIQSYEGETSLVQLFPQL